MLGCSKLSVKRQQRVVFADVTVDFHPGQWTAIVGPNGAGKSTLLLSLAGLLTPAHGRVHLQGRDLTLWPNRERAKAMAWMGQGDAVSGELLSWDVVMLARLPTHGLFQGPTPLDEQAVHSALAETEAVEFSCRRIQTLSGGERQRVLLARLLAHEAPVLLLDEPLVHLDPPHQSLLIQALKRRTAQGGTVITVLHELTQALAADRLVVLGPHGVLGDGAPTDPVVQHALLEVFGGAVSIERLSNGRLVALPR